MSVYSDTLSNEYAAKRGAYTATDKEAFAAVDSIGLEGKRVLDLGCGDGVYTEALLARGAASVVGVDNSGRMIELAQSRYRDSRVSYLVADATTLPFSDDEFDFVFANFVLHHIEDAGSALREVYRVLKPGAVMVATFGAYNIPAALSVEMGTPGPVMLSDGVTETLMHNIVRPVEAIKSEYEKAGFKLDVFKSIANANARMHESHPYLGKIELVTTLAVSRK